MTRMEVRIRRIEQASVLNLRSHSISTFNHYDRRIDEVYWLATLFYLGWLCLSNSSGSDRKPARKGNAPGSMSLQAQVLGYNRVADAGGGVADALSWFDRTVRQQQRQQQQQEEEGAGPGRPMPPSTRRQRRRDGGRQLERGDRPAAGVRRGRGGGRGGGPAARAAVDLPQAGPQLGGGNLYDPATAGLLEPPRAPDLKSFREYLLQQPPSLSAREARSAVWPAGALKTPYSPPVSAVSAPPGGGMGSAASAEVMSSLGQLYARLTALESSEASLQRTVAQQEAELRTARQEAGGAAKQSQQLAQLEERLRTTEVAEGAHKQRLRAVEAGLGESSAAARERIAALEVELQSLARSAATAEQQLANAAGQQRELHGDLEGVHDKLAERVEKYSSALNEQVSGGIDAVFHAAVAPLLSTSLR
jgi:hypothetical protein